MRARLFVVLFAVLLSACAGRPVFDAKGVAKDLSPSEVVARKSPDGTRVLWGGVIVATNNLKDTTQIEILAYPLGRNQAPRTDETPLGRFVALQKGYLESADYSAGREITLLGTLSGTREGRIGESEYTYPVVAPEKIHLWPRETVTPDLSPRLHFGVGVIFH